MELVIIGASKEAAKLGRMFIQAGHHIAQVVSRESKAASELAYEWQTVSTNYQGPVTRKADVYIAAFSDEKTDDIVTGLQLPGMIVAHTSATLPKEVLRTMSERYGVFYPVALHAGGEVGEVPRLFVDASDLQARDVLEQLAVTTAGFWKS